MPPKKIPVKIPFECPLCNQTVHSHTFPEHCCLKHNLIPSQQCPWCFGHQQLRGDAESTKHTAACCERFMKTLPRRLHPVTTTHPASPTTSDEPVPFDLTPMCKDVVALDPATFPLRLIDLQLDDEFYFQSQPLNWAVACVRHFLNQRQVDWCHVMVRESAWPAFCAGVDNQPVEMLPFTCFCKGSSSSMVGGGGGDHRHFILKGLAKGDFGRVWKKLALKNNHARKQKIESPMDLVDALDFMSQEASTCDFTFRRSGAEKRHNHYNVTASLPQRHKTVLAFEWDGGIVDWMHQQYASVDPSVLAPVASRIDGLWVVKFSDLPGFDNQLVLPVSKQFRPCRSKTRFYLHLHHGRQCHFEVSTGGGGGDKDADEGGGGGWIRDQAKRGNTLLQLIGDCLYYPTHYQQRCIQLIRPLVENVITLQTGFEEKQDEVKMLEEAVTELKTTNQSWKRKFISSEEDLKMLQRKHIRYLEQENDYLRMQFGNKSKMP